MSADEDAKRDVAILRGYLWQADRVDGLLKPEERVGTNKNIIAMELMLIDLIRAVAALSMSG
jgi:hypothetical protein